MKEPSKENYYNYYVLEGILQDLQDVTDDIESQKIYQSNLEDKEKIEELLLTAMDSVAEIKKMLIGNKK